MDKILLDQKDFTAYLEKGETGDFFFLSKLADIDLSDKNTAEIELLPEGQWEHPMAFNGKFIVTKGRIDAWISNFKKKIFGDKLPLDFYHRSDSKSTPGFIINLYRISLDTWNIHKKKFKSKAIQDQIAKKIQSGKSLLFATLHITEPDVWQKVINGSLQWISAAVSERWKDPMSKNSYDIIKGAALTNYPYIKNMTPISVNFEEHFEITTPEHSSEHKEELVNDLEILTDELDLEEVEEIESEDGLAFFAKDNANKGNKSYGFKPKDKKEPYGFVPKVAIPPEIAKLPKSQQKAWMALFNKAFRVSKDVEKAKKEALRIAKTKYGFKFEYKEEDVEDTKTFTAKFGEFVTLIKGLGFKMVKEGEKDTKDPVSLEELNSLKTEVVALTIFKDAALVKENEVILKKYSKITPAAQKILLSLLNMRSDAVELEAGKKTSIRAILLELLTEVEKSPNTNIFEVISESHDEKLEDLNSRAMAYMKTHPDVTFTDALLEVAPKKG